MTEQSIPWCCTGRGYVSECPLCPQYGTSLLDPCPGHPDTPNNRQTIDTARLHAERRHPDWEYATTSGPRKQWDNPEEPPHDEYGEPEPGWEANVDAGRPGQGWDRFDYHEEAYWRRRKADQQTPKAVATSCAGFPDHCPYLLTVEPDPPRHEGGVRCGCNARQDLEDMAFQLATGIGIVDPREHKATLDRYASQILNHFAAHLDNLPDGGEALKGPYWYRGGIKDAADLARDKADHYQHEAEKRTRPKEQG